MGLLAVLPVAGTVSKPAMGSLFVALGILLLAAAAWRNRSALRLPGDAAVLLALFLAYVALTHLALIECASCRPRAVEKTVVLTLALWATTGPWLAVEPLDGDRVVRWLGAGIVAAASILLVELVLDSPIMRLWLSPAEEAVLTPSRYNRVTSALVVLAWPVAALLAGRRRGGVALAVLALVTAIALLSQSTAAALSAAVGWIVLALATVAPRATLASGLVLTAAFLVGAPLVLAQGLDWASPFLASMPYSFADRLEIWDHSARTVLTGPWWGHGIEATRQLSVDPAAAAGYSHMRKSPLHPHDAAIQLWIELGVAGPLFGLAVLGLVWRRVASLPPEIAPYAVAATATILVPSLLSYGLWQLTWIGVIGATVVAFRCLAAAGGPAADRRA